MKKKKLLSAKIKLNSVEVKKIYFNGYVERT